MAYHIEKGTGDLVISGFEKGIASSPHTGIADLKNLNISSMPGEVMLNYGRTRQTSILFPGSSLSYDTNVTLLSDSGLLRGTWVHITSSNITDLNSGSYYYIKSQSGAGVVTVSATYEGAVINTFTPGVASFEAVAMGQPVAYTIDYSLDTIGGTLSYYVLDATGLIWKSPPGVESADSPLGTWSLIDYTAAPAANAYSGFFAYKGYIHVVTDAIYWKATGTTVGLQTAWAAMNGTSGILDSINHYALLGHDSGDGTVYICDGSSIDSLTTIPGVSYNPAGTNNVNYTFSLAALKLPVVETATKLAEIATGNGTQLLIGGINNVLYPWDKLSPFYGGLIYLPENYTQQMVSVNNLVYIFCGSKGNIYITNGSSATSVMTVSDYVANSTGTNQDPYFIWGGAMYLRGRVWFSVQAPNCGGIWSFIPTINYYVTEDTGASIRLENINSYDTFDGVATILFAPQLTTSQNVNGPQYWAGYDDGTGGASFTAPYGIDFSSTYPYVSGNAIIETDAIPTGILLDKKTFKQIECKFAAPLVSTTLASPLAAGATTGTLSSVWSAPSIAQHFIFSTGEIRLAVLNNGSASFSLTQAVTQTTGLTVLLEGIQLYYRKNLTDAWTSLGSVVIEPSEPLSGYFVANFEKTQWLQLRALVYGTQSGTPSFTRFTEFRIR